MPAEKALIYCRVSEDRAGGRSPAEQETEARAVCKREGWKVVEVITDTHGASRHSKGTRAGWARVKERLASGDVDVLVTWEASRAQRDLTAYAELRDLCAKHKVRWCYQGRVHDLTTKQGRFDTGLDALLAEREAEEISDRVKRAMRANAARGMPHGRRLFGYERTYDPTTGALTGQQPHPAEAGVVRRIFADYLAGVGVRTIARRLRAEGHTTGTGAAWADGQVSRVLANPAYAGRRVHYGQVVGVASWPPLVDDATFDRAQAITAGRRAANTRYVGTARLLTSVGRCGKCGGKLTVLHDRNHRKVYGCKDRFEVTRDLAKLDAYVTDALLEHLRTRKPPGRAHSREERAARRQIAVERSRLDDATQQFVVGALSAATLAKIEATIGANIAELEKRAKPAAVGDLSIVVPDDPGAAWAWWGAMEPARRRGIVNHYIAAVIIYPTLVRGRRTFDEDAVNIEWR